MKGLFICKPDGNLFTITPQNVYSCANNQFIAQYNNWGIFDVFFPGLFVVFNSNI